MFKRLICDGTHSFRVSHQHSLASGRGGKIGKLALMAGAALAIPAAWPLFDSLHSRDLQAQLPPSLPDLVMEESTEAHATSTQKHPSLESDDLPPFVDDAHESDVRSTVAQASEAPPFDDNLFDANDAPPFNDDRVIQTSFQAKRKSRAVIHRVSVLTTEDVRNIITRARLELAAGDVELAHRFAEAAAEVPIPIEYFKAQPQAVLDEIEFTTQLQNADYQQKVAEKPGAKTPSNSNQSLSDTAPPPFDETSATNAALPIELPQESFVKTTKASKVELLPEDPFGDSDLKSTEVLDNEKPQRAAVPMLPLPESVTTSKPPIETKSLATLPTDSSDSKPQPTGTTGIKDDIELKPMTSTGNTVRATAADLEEAVSEQKTPDVVSGADANSTPVAAPSTVAQTEPPKQNAVTDNTAVQPVPMPATPVRPRPLGPTERLKKAPRAYQALTMKSLNVQPKPTEGQTTPPRLPDSPAKELMAKSGTVKHTTGVGREWGTTIYMWEAPAYRHDPLYFEEPQLERYGNEVPFVQPAISAGHFFGSFATLPYQMGIEGNGPITAQHDLRCERPGDCATYSWQRLPWSNTGAATQAGAVLGLIFIIP